MIIASTSPIEGSITAQCWLVTVSQNTLRQLNTLALNNSHISTFIKNLKCSFLVSAFIQYFWIWICKSVLKPSEVYIRSCSGSWKYVRRLNAKNYSLRRRGCSNMIFSDFWKPMLALAYLFGRGPRALYELDGTANGVQQVKLQGLSGTLMEYEGACEMLLVNAVRNCMCVCVTGVASDLNIPLWSPIQLFVRVSFWYNPVH